MSRRLRNLGARPEVLLSGAALLLLLCAWLFANPPGAAPDEETHYIKAAAISQGEWRGGPAQVPTTPQENHRMWLWNKSLTRNFYLPARLAPLDFAGCYAFYPDIPAGCIYRLPKPPAGEYQSYAAIYQPTAYLLPSLLIRFAPNSTVGLMLGRVATVLVTGTLLLLALAAIWDGAALSLIGLAAAVSPMAIFLTAALSNSATEVAGGIGFFAALLRLVRDRAGSNRAALAALALGGIALGASRPTGPPWVGIDVVVAALLLGPAGIREVWRTTSNLGRSAYAVVIVAVLFDLGWTKVVGGELRAPFHLILDDLGPAFQQFPAIIQQQIGVFGWLDTPMSGLNYVLWGAVALALILGALLAGSWRERAALILLMVLYVGAVTAISADLLAASDFTSQGRYYLPVAVAIPLLAGWILSRHRIGLPVALVAALVIAGVQFTAWWENARRYAVGAKGPRLFLLHTVSWSPPAGWWLWAVVALAGAACLFLAIVMAGVAESARNRSPA